MCANVGIHRCHEIFQTHLYLSSHMINDGSFWWLCVNHFPPT
uniref:Uncharacterized protein n=1 Tax=Rhizophora mucronata TaxID=61149 RepID=A0A2P2Q3H0_RHIMU